MLYRALTQPCKVKAKVREEIDEIPHHTLMDSTPINSNGTIYDKPNNNKEVKAKFMLHHFMQPTPVPKFNKTMSVEGWMKAVKLWSKTHSHIPEPMRLTMILESLKTNEDRNG